MKNNFNCVHEKPILLKIKVHLFNLTIGIYININMNMIFENHECNVGKICFDYKTHNIELSYFLGSIKERGYDM